MFFGTENHAVSFNFQQGIDSGRFSDRSEARELLGDDWVQRHRRTVQQHATAYQRSSWGKVTTLLTGQGLQAGGQEGAVNRQAVKDR